MTKKVTIRSLPENPIGAAVYVRKSGETFIRLNENFHVKCKKSADGLKWIGDGMAEEIDHDEHVEVIQRNGKDEAAQSV